MDFDRYYAKTRPNSNRTTFTLRIWQGPESNPSRPLATFQVQSPVTAQLWDRESKSTYLGFGDGSVGTIVLSPDDSNHASSIQLETLIKPTGEGISSLSVDSGALTCLSEKHLIFYELDGKQLHRLQLSTLIKLWLKDCTHDRIPGAKGSIARPRPLRFSLT
ncbi:hypothetical protein R3P38DRAFT_2793028 [Favolaschia claudopus]|uniref:Uncharacterized protein n=1 Tax=Favolaschia claudopus TaxID=2862362 RepID=A0AAW0ADS7_9AGAR